MRTEKKAVRLVGFYATGNRIPELIVVGVGHPNEEGLTGLGKRTIDLFPSESSLSEPGPALDYMRRQMSDWGLDPDTDLFADARGDRFLDFLIDRLRPALQEQYRLADDHALFGHSAGGAFTGYVLFARPGGFDRYIIGDGLKSVYADEAAKLEAPLY